MKLKRRLRGADVVAVAAIWDNRSVFHSATYDFQGSRTGQRVSNSEAQASQLYDIRTDLCVVK